MNLPMLDRDTANHMIYGYGAGLLGQAAARAFGHPELAGLAAQASALVAGLVKEGADWLANQAAKAASQKLPHTVELKDIVATWAGGLQVHAVLAVGVP